MRAKHILSRMPLNDFFQLNKNTLRSVTGFSLSFLNKLNFKDALNSAEIEVNQLNKNKVSFSFYDNDSYPNRLKNCSDPPLILYHYGNGKLSPKKTEKLNNIEVRLFNIISKNDGPVKVNKTT